MRALAIMYSLIFVLCFQQVVNAQETVSGTRINGMVTDGAGKPMEFATVVLFKAADSVLVKTALTEPSGKFQFSVTEDGEYYVLTTFVGYTKVKSKVFRVEGATPDIDLGRLELRATSKNLKEINVVAAKPLFERKIDKLVMNVSNSSIATGSTALEVLQRAPGVAVDQNDNISMKGKQGVLIMLDGKPTYMSSTDVANLLRNMQSSQIESIELITNPSARYDASGNSGIINIKTIKSQKDGTNGSISLGANYWQRWREYGSISLNHRSGRFNIFGNYDYGGGKRNNHIEINRLAKGNPNTYFSQNTNIVPGFSNNNMKAGIDFTINDRNTLGVMVTGYFNAAKEDGNVETLIGAKIGSYDSSLVAKNKSKDHFNNLTYNINYKSVLDSNGQELSVDLDYSRMDGKEIANYNNWYYYANGDPIRPLVLNRNTTPTNVDIKVFKVDYTLPLANKLKLEAGVKGSWVRTDNNLLAERQSGGEWVNREELSNHFIYDENVMAGYLNFYKEFKSTSVQAGLRAENTSSKGNSVTANSIVERNYLNFFPSVFVTQDLGKDHSLGISYSRRIDRPDYSSLNPFVYYLDQYTYQKGNPYLKPQYANSVELSYTFQKKYSLTFNYNKLTDVISEAILPDSASKGFYQVFENLAKQYYYGASISVPVKPFKWWDMYNNLDVFNLQFKSPNLAGQAVNTNKTTMMFKSNNSFSLYKGLNGEVSFSYRSAANYGVIKTEEQHYVDVGLSKSLLNNKLNIKFAISDLFNTYETHLSSAYTGFNYRLYQKLDSRRAKLTITYKFGSKDVKAQRKRSTGTENEVQRLKN